MLIPQDYVADATFFLSWVCEDERSEVSEAAWKQIRHAGRIVVPPIFLYETIGVLVDRRFAKRGNRKSERPLVAEILALLEFLPMEIVSSLSGKFFGKCVELAQEHQIPFSDSTYLALALDYKLPLATRDQLLASAARSRGLHVLGD